MTFISFFGCFVPFPPNDALGGGGGGFCWMGKPQAISTLYSSQTETRVFHLFTLQVDITRIMVPITR